jgi:anti-sigma factor RsiW
MTDLTHSAPHLDDEQLSAHIDGEGHDAVPASDAGTVEAHLATCEGCRRRLEALGAARALLAQPVVPVAPSLRAAAVQAAVTDGPATPVHDDDVPTPISLHPRRPVSRLLVGAAAAVAVLVVAVGVSLGLSHAPSSPSPSATGALGSAQHRAASAPAASATTRPVTSLGSLSSPSALKARLTPLLPTGDYNVQGQAAELAPATTGAPATSGSPATTGAPTNSGAEAATPAGADALRAGAVTACQTTAQRAAGSNASVVLVATATYEHRAALVVVSTLPASATGGPVRVAVVVATTGCRVLDRTTV